MIILWSILRVAVLALLIYGISTGRIAKAYFWLCWRIGMKDKDNNESTLDDREYITFMLRRQVQRLKEWWWVMSLGTIVGLTVLVVLLAVYGHWGYLDLPVALLGLSLWLLPHVMFTAVFPPEKKR